MTRKEYALATLVGAPFRSWLTKALSRLLMVRARVRPRLWQSICTIGLLATEVNLAHAQALNVDLKPTLGTNTPRVPGWNSFLAEVTNLKSQQLHLTLYLLPTRFANHPRFAELAQSKAQIALAPHGRERVRLQASGTDDGQFTMLAVSRAAADETSADRGSVEQGRAQWSLRAAGVPYLVELLDAGGVPSTGVYGGQTAAMTGRQRITFARSSLSAAQPSFALPIRPAEYAAATVVMASVTVLDALDDLEWTALWQWVVAGGTLAVAHTDIGSFDGSRLSLLVPDLAQTRPTTSLTQGIALAANASNPNHWSFESKSKDDAAELPALAYEHLVGFAGRDLRDTAYGAVQTYGLGEIHLLGFNPHSPPFAGLAWTETKLNLLVEAAWLRRRHVVMPLGRQRPEDARTYAIRQRIGAPILPRSLPYALPAAAIAYAAGLAAVIIILARRRRSLRWLLAAPAFACVCALAVVGAARAVLGPQQRTHHLSLTELGAGMGYGARTLYRQFTTWHRLAIEPVLHGGAVALVHPASAGGAWAAQAPPRLLLTGERPGSSPASVLVREDGMTRLGRGVHITLLDGDIVVTNRTGMTLAGVILRAPDGRVTFFDRIADHERVRQSAGRRVRVLSAPAAAKYFPLLLDSFEHHLDAAIPGASKTWAAVEALRSEQVDWWPADVPVLLASVLGGSGVVTDSGFPVTLDRTLIRVVGFGGRP